jgi:hypothetical protein
MSSFVQIYSRGRISSVHGDLPKKHNLLYVSGSAQKEWGHLVNPQHCLDLLPSPKPVAVHTQSPYHSPNPNDVTHNTSVVVCNLYCDRSSDRQISGGRNLRRFRQTNINHDIHKTQLLIISSIIIILKT